MRAYYEEPRGGFARMPGAALITALAGGGALMGGQMGGEGLLEGPLSFLAPVAGLVTSGLPMTDDRVSWALAGLIAGALGLLISLASAPRRKGLMAASVLALVFFGLMLAGGRGERIAADLAERAGLDEVIETLPAPVTPQAALSCPDGTFADGEACRSCRVERVVRTGPALTFAPVRTEAAWGYAEDDAFAAYAAANARAGSAIRGTAALSALPVAGDALCAADGALVLGSASSDGPSARNEARARRRAERLAGEVRRRCPGLPVFAASLGQSDAARDAAADRAITVLAVTARDAAVSAQTVEAELGHALATGLGEAPLLTRLANFEGEWVWVAGGAGRFRPEAAAQPTERVWGYRDDAPAFCFSDA